MQNNTNIAQVEFNFLLAQSRHKLLKAFDITNFSLISNWAQPP